MTAAWFTLLVALVLAAQTASAQKVYMLISKLCKIMLIFLNWNIYFLSSTLVFITSRCVRTVCALFRTT